MSSLIDNLIREERALILRALYEIYPSPLGESLLMDDIGQKQQVKVSVENMHRALDYLRGHGRIAIVHRDDVWIARITPVGIAYLETAEMGQHDAIRIGKIHMLRLRVLQALQSLPMRAMPESMIGKYLRDDTDLDLTENSIHRACAYLCDTGRANWVGSPDSGMLRITSMGIDFLEGDGDDDLGMKRPARL